MRLFFQILILLAKLCDHRLLFRRLVRLQGHDAENEARQAKKPPRPSDEPHA